MKILIIEDNTEKLNLIKSTIDLFFKKKDLQSDYYIHEVRFLSAIHKPIQITKYDLIIFDVYLPLEKGFEDQNCASQIISCYKDSININSEAIVITAQPNTTDSILFNENGVFFIEYDLDKGWENTLNIILEKVSKKITFDFLIFCALTKERKAYINTEATLGNLRKISNLDCQEITINGMKGLCIKPIRMGLISMAITATKAIEMFEPRFVGISGICAGFGTTKILDVIICTHAWEYQTGKYSNGTFIQEPYQINLPPESQTEVSQFIENTDLKNIICQGIEKDINLRNMEIVMGPIASGSVVIEDEKKMDEILSTHRKLLGLEMEINALYEAASQTSCKPKFLAIKTATDFGDSNKPNTENYQELGATLSARCMVEFMKKHL